MADNTNAEDISAELPKQRSCTPCGCVCAVLGVLLFSALVDFGAPIAARHAARRIQCTNQLKQINLALLNYEQANRCLPPAYVADAKGRPLYSWRVLILPYIEQGDLYKRIRLNEPWDSPHNRSVLQIESVAKLFHCPSAENPKDETSYVMIVGPNTTSDGPHSVRLADLKDGVSNTILVAEIKDSGIHWAAPRDLDFESMSFQINDPVGKGIGSYHSETANVGLADGAVRCISNGFDPTLVKALITINGGEDVSDFHSR